MGKKKATPISVGQLITAFQASVGRVSKLGPELETAWRPCSPPSSSGPEVRSRVASDRKAPQDLRRAGACRLMALAIRMLPITVGTIQ